MGRVSGPESGFTPRQELKIRAATAAGLALHHTLANTYRMRFVGAPWGLRRRRGHPGHCVYATWHCDIWHLLRVMRGEEGSVCVMISEHRDGEFIARIVQHLGFDTARGSSTRGGARALLELARSGRDRGTDLMLTVDGPRGPAREVKEGVVLLASRAGLPIVPLRIVADRAWHARSWDRLAVAKPFARVAAAFGDEIRVPADAGREDLAGRWVAEVADGMRRAEERAQAALLPAAR